MFMLIPGESKKAEEAWIWKERGEWRQNGVRLDGIIGRGSGEKGKGGGSKEVEEVWMKKEHEERRKQRMGKVRTEMEEEE